MGEQAFGMSFRIDIQFTRVQNRTFRIITGLRVAFADLFPGIGQGSFDSVGCNDQCIGRQIVPKSCRFVEEQG